MFWSPFHPPVMEASPRGALSDQVVDLETGDEIRCSEE